MPTFVVSLRLPESFDEAFIALIPRHREFINRLLAEHVIEAYAISADRSRGWVTINGDDAEAVRAIVAQFPLYHYLGQIEIDELFIFDSAAARFPHISLN
jgi:aspartate 1-decarboxylase